MPPTSAPSPDVVRRLFVSYAREDRSWAIEQARVARRSGIDVFIDEDSLRAGEDWPERLRRAIEESDQVVLGWSTHAAASDWVRKEYELALRMRESTGRQRFLTIDRLDDTPLPPDLGKVQAERSALSSSAPVERLLYEPDRQLPDPPLPSLLLRPEYGVVPFRGREKTLEDLEQWCGSAEPLALTLYWGPGGTGKTRLMVEACRRLRAEGWDARFLQADATQDALTAAPEAIDALVEPRRPRLIVIDYAETRREQVRALIQRGVAKEGGQPVRLVLLSRAVGDWWTELAAGSVLYREFLGARSREVALEHLAPTLEDRTDSFASAAEAFAARLGLEVPSSTPNLADDLFGRALFVHLAAWAAVHGGAANTRSELLETILGHEREYWTRLATAAKLDEAVIAGLGAGVAAIALFGGSDSGQDLWDRVLCAAPDLAERGRAERKAVGRVFHELYEHDGRIEPLQPDLLGEELLARELEADRGLLTAWLDAASETELHHGLTVLNRMAEAHPASEHWMSDAVAHAPDTVVEAAIAVAIEGGDPIGRVVADRLHQTPNPGLASKLEPRLPTDSLALRELGAAITEQALSAMDQDSQSEEDRTARARLLNNLGYRLSDLGQRDPALEATQQAVEIRRQLAEARPEPFLPDLAGSLNNLGKMLSELGQREPALEAAQEAVDIFRQLAEARPDTFLPYLARGFNNLGNRLSDLGQREPALEAAQEAADIYRQLAEARPGAFLPDLAMSLNNRGNMLSHLGQREPALGATQEAVELYRPLAEARPDAFLPYLATSLNNLGNTLSDLGQWEPALEAAQEAVEIRRQLAEARPEAFLPDLATSLNSLGNTLSGLGQRELALEATQEAVEIRRQLAEARPEAFLPDLAMSLNNLGGVLSDLGQREPALEATQEAVELYRPLAEARPAAFLSDLAMSLNNLGKMLSDLERIEPALEATKEAVDIFRQLAEARPEAFLPYLATSLNNLGNTLSELGQKEPALGTAQEAVDILRRLAEARPNAFLPDLAMSLYNLGNRLSELGQSEPALEVSQEAVEIFRQLAEERPAAFLGYLATSLYALGGMLSNLGLEEEAAAVANELATLAERLGSE